MIFDEKRLRSKLTLVTILEYIIIQYISKITYIDYKPLWFKNRNSILIVIFIPFISKHRTVFEPVCPVCRFLKMNCSVSMNRSHYLLFVLFARCEQLVDGPFVFFKAQTTCQIEDFVLGITASDLKIFKSSD